MKCAARLIIAALLITAVAAVSLIRLVPPGGDDPRDGFDTGRALKHLRVIAREPHPLGSPANEVVRAYLIAQFQKLGFETRTPEQRVSGPKGGFTVDYTVHNVIARLRGAGGDAGNGQAVMLAAHYDSVAAGPGAGDDGAAVAALLEVARVLASDEKLRRDVIFLITDGEEQDLLGAKAFVTSDEWRGLPGVVFNFEARGTSGPSIMFETSHGNAWLVDHYAQVAPHPITTSLSSDVYKRMPNRTDFTIFKHAGISGLGFAFIGSYENYHAPTDDIDHLSVRSMRHHGQQALSLARRFGNLPVLSANETEPNLVYFDVLGLFVVRYRASAALPLAIAAVVGWFIATILLVRRRAAQLIGVVVGFLSTLVGAVIVVFIGWALSCAVDARWLHLHADAFIIGLIAVAMFVPIALQWLLPRRCRTTSLMTGALLIWAVLNIVAAIVSPGGSYLLTWPLVMGTLALIPFAVDENGVKRWLRDACVAAPLLMIVVLIVPVVYAASLAAMAPFAWVVMGLPALVGAIMSPLFREADRADAKRSLHDDLQNAHGVAIEKT